MLEKLLQWDRDTFIYLNSLGIEEYDTFWTIVTDIKTWIPLYLLFLFICFYKSTLKLGFLRFAMFLCLVSFIITVTNLTKTIVERLRPNNDTEINTLIRILKSPTDYSFFSGHSASSFAITIFMVLLFQKKTKWIWLFLFWPILFASSRIFVGVHFPIDIIVGALVGILSACLFYLVHRWLRTKINT